MARLTVVLPVCGDELLSHIEGEVRSWVSTDSKVEVVNIEKGPASIESEYDEALAGPGILEAVQHAVEGGADAVFITCFGDPAVHAAREIVDIPIVGGFEPAMLTALSLGERVGIITVLPNVVPMIRGLLHRYGLARRCDAVEVVDVPVLSLGDGEVLATRLHERARALIDDGRADVIVLGCTGMVGVAAQLQSRLAAHGPFVPVVDPTGAAVLWLESALRLGVRPSRTTYMRPPDKVRSR
ncbi:MAG TPA: aspartate/glutamate racemase family protein [Acidimicrobiales bacterium]|nr:aspartate/glutamate racemase family protein [Acidimicrobiales bacterium]